MSIKYIIQKGDTLRSIANKYGVDLNELIKVTQKGELTVGSEIVIPGGEGVKTEELHKETMVLMSQLKSALDGVRESIDQLPAPKNEIEVIGFNEAIEKLLPIIDKIDDISDNVIKVEITNHQEPVKEMVVVEKNPLESVKVSNFPHLPKSFVVEGLGKLLALIEKISNRNNEVVVTNSNPEKPISVQLSDGKNFYKAVSNFVSNTGIVKTAVDRLYDKLSQVYVFLLTKDEPLLDNDKHVQVDVLTMPEIVIPVVEGGSTELAQTDGSQKTQIVEKIPTDSTKLNASLMVTQVVVGTVTTKTITKIIGAISLVKTVAKDSSDNSLSVSTWSVVT